MAKKFYIKPIINKRNNQINFSLKRKDLPKDLLKDIMNVKKIRFELGEWE